MQEYIVWAWQAYKNKNGVYELKKEYYTGYVKLGCFGFAANCSWEKEDAKRFTTKSEAQDEIKKIGRRPSTYKFEKV